MEAKIKEIQLRVQSVLTRKDDRAAVSIYYDSIAEAWQAWVDVIDSWRIYMVYGLSAEAASAEEVISSLHLNITVLNKTQLRKIVKGIIERK